MAAHVYWYSTYCCTCVHVQCSVPNVHCTCIVFPPIKLYCTYVHVHVPPGAQQLHWVTGTTVLQYLARCRQFKTWSISKEVHGACMINTCTSTTASCQHISFTCTVVVHKPIGESATINGNIFIIGCTYVCRDRNVTAPVKFFQFDLWSLFSNSTGS